MIRGCDNDLNKISQVSVYTNLKRKVGKNCKTKMTQICDHFTLLYDYENWINFVFVVYLMTLFCVELRGNN
jgi:hypothetical protein